MTTPARLMFDHLLRMTDNRGTFTHACFADPRRGHGYCTDDMARVLVVTSREPDPTPEVHGLACLALGFLTEAPNPEGAYRNRMDVSGRWKDAPAVGDCWGRSLWALGTAATCSAAGWFQRSAVMQFERAAQQRTRSPRAMAFAALGSVELLTVDPGNRAAIELITDYANGISDSSQSPAWPWPERRLTYANAVLAEARIAAGVALDRPAVLDQGLALLAWLVSDQMAGGYLSPSPAGGREIGDPRPAFAQRPIEVSTLADACARAAAIDSSAMWPEGIAAAADWFHGANDSGQAMWDPQTGGGFDGLLKDGVDRNQGTESTLALLSTFQHAQHPSPVTR